MVVRAAWQQWRAALQQQVNGRDGHRVGQGSYVQRQGIKIAAGGGGGVCFVGGCEPGVVLDENLRHIILTDKGDPVERCVLEVLAALRKKFRQVGLAARGGEGVGWM